MSEIRERRKVLLGITGSVAAYKAAELARLLIKRGYEVRCVMTEAASEFITPMLMESLTGAPVLTDVFEAGDDSQIGHIQIADWADAYVIAPATANIIARLAYGFAECPVSTVALATKAPILVCPAMNVNMWNNPVTLDNVDKLKARGVEFVDPEEGSLACGWEGSGRLADPWEIFHYVRRALSDHDFKGKRILIASGPTREAIDPVRFISNRSSGKMGIALAREAFRRGAEVTIVHGPVDDRIPVAVKRVPILSARELHEAMLKHSFEADQQPDIIIMAAAVSDFRPKDVSPTKMKKKDMGKSIALIENPDILADLGSRRKGTDPVLVGFAVETGEMDDLLADARAKLKKKGADIIVGNFAHEALELDTNRVWIISRMGEETEVATTYKSRVANRILDSILKF
jgi:phosphopantothenoylcysteine decarboxylase/phosphopantothenate--cysteine ligase